MRLKASSPAAVTGALCLAFLLSACGPPAGSPGSTTTASPTFTATADATETAAATATATPTATTTSSVEAGWTSYTTSDGELMFDLPSEWSVKDPAGEVPAEGGLFVDVLNADGKSMANLRTNVVTGAVCTDKTPYALMDSQPLPALAREGQTPRFMFESRPEADPAKVPTASYGITSGPEPTGPDACPIFHFFTWPPSGAMFGGTYDPMNPTHGEMHVDTHQAYMETKEYKNIKKMITSLRPAG